MKTGTKTRRKTNRNHNGGKRTKSRKKSAGRGSKEFERLKCGPVQENYFTCYDNATLHKLRDGWNMRHPDARIETNDPKEVWTALKQRFGRMCRNEACWMKQIMGVQTQQMRPENATALVGAGMLSVLVFPLVGFAILDRSRRDVPLDGEPVSDELPASGSGTAGA